MKKCPVNFRENFENIKTNNCTITEGQIDYIKSLESKGVHKKINITIKLFKKANKINEFKNTFIKNARDAQIIL